MDTITITDRNFIKEVLESQVPVLLDFWAPWCGSCRTAAPVLDEIAEEQNVKVGKVNVHEYPVLAAELDVMGIPSLIVFKGGKIVNKFVGVQPKQRIVQML